MMNVKLNVLFRRKKVIIFLVLLISLLITAVFIFVNNKEKEIDESLFNQKDLHMLLNKTYFEGNNVKNFSSVGIVDPKPNIYQFYWILNIINNFNSTNTNNYLEQCSDILKYSSVDNLSNRSPNELLQIAYINKSLDKEQDIYKYLDLINNIYSKEESLFFSSSLSDTIEEKLVSTRSIITTIKDAGLSISEEEEIKIKLIELYNSDEFFESGDLNIFDNAMNIICTLKKLGYSYKNLKSELKDRSEWLKFWNENIYKYVEFDISYLGLFTSLIDVNSFYDKDYKIKDEYFSGFLKQNNNFSKISGIDMIGYIDPQLVFNSYMFLEGQKYEYPYFKDLNNYIEENLNCDFIKSGVASLNPEDNYYGIYLSELSKYTYEKQQMIPFMLQQYHLYEEKISSKVDSDSLRNIYFTTVSLSELGQNIEKLGIKQETINSIIDYFSNLKYTENIDEQQKNLSDFYYSYSLLNLVKVNISDTIISKVYKSISKYSIVSSDNVDMLFYLYYLLDNMHNSQEISAIKDKISKKFDALCFNSEGNLKFIGSTLSIDDIYKALRIINDTSGLTPNKKQKIREYLVSSIKKRHMEVFEFSNESTTLRAVYYAYLISKVC